MTTNPVDLGQGDRLAGEDKHRLNPKFPVELAVEALKPFAEASENLDANDRDGDNLWESPEAMMLTAGDLRRASEALAVLQALPVREGEGQPNHEALRSDGWREIESAPLGVDFLALGGARGDVRRCWRHKPSSRTDEILTFTRNGRFKATHWMPLPDAPVLLEGGGSSQSHPSRDAQERSPVTQRDDGGREP